MTLIFHILISRFYCTRDFCPIISCLCFRWSFRVNLAKRKVTSFLSFFILFLPTFPFSLEMLPPPSL